MTIVTKSSLTLSNVNDGTITHTAWSWSADGTDRFTTVYPNLNLLKGTKTPNSLTGNNTSNQASAVYFFDNNKNIQNQGLSVGDTLTCEFDWDVSNPTSGSFVFQLNNTNWTNISQRIFITSENKSGHSKYSFVVDAGFLAGVATGINRRADYLPTNSVLTISNVFFTKGSTDISWMPSLSEVKTADYPSYRGEYLDYSSTASTDPSKYSWGLIKGNDSYTHTAYSWSADGTDRFTTVYPNLNLGDNTKTFTGADGATGSITGSIRIDPATQKTQDGDFNYLTYKSTRDNSDWFRFFLIPDTVTPNMTKVAVIPNTNYTFSVWLKGTGQHTIYAYNSWTAPNTPWSLQINLTNDWKLYTFTVTSKDVIPNSNVQFFIRSNNATEISLKKPKVEQGSTVTPYMPSSSEVKTSDYPNYIGTYSDSNVESSLDYKKYQWAIFKGQNSNAYTAYSWSSDGTDRFSTVYPNLNLFTGTSDEPSTKTGDNWNIAVIGVYNTPKVGQEYTVSVEVPNADHDVWMEVYRWNAERGRIDMLTRTVIKSGAKGYVTFTWSDPGNSGATQFATNLAWTNGTDTGTYSYRKAKLEIGNTVTPWMPSESEVQDQWQDAIPMYVGVGEKDSQNPTDYRWQLNPRYVQASSDSGLSNKAGVDDLASVANTANDALVQAQNAVSNEDYTSWLEHDYQTTINNIQDVSAQNQEDINNVDDRTTIVEGFYGEMKVKWNFIDESFTFSEEGMFISNAQSKMAIQVTSDKIVFWDNNVDVAFITGEVLNIQKGVFLESATIGNHLITKFSDSSPVTIIRYVGGIT